jgi:hypothetical protein
MGSPARHSIDGLAKAFRIDPKTNKNARGVDVGYGAPSVALQVGVTSLDGNQVAPVTDPS